MFKKATKSSTKLRLAFYGGPGTGKTYTALRLATRFGRVAVLDTEHGSSQKYADEFAFDVSVPESFHPQVYINAITQAAKAGYDVVVLDSLSHAWDGKGGVLEIKDKATKKYGGNSYAAWQDATPLHRELIEAILSADVHVIAAMRAKTDYVMEEYGSGSKKKMRPRKVGLAPVQRDGMEYEFDVVGKLTTEHDLVIEKTRCRPLTDQVIPKPGEELATLLMDWLGEGASGKDTTDNTPPQPSGDGAPPDKAKGGNSVDGLPFEPPPITETTEWTKFHALGSKLYGKDWDKKRTEFVEWVTGGRATSSKELKIDELRRIVEGMEEHLEKTGAMVG